MEASVARRPVVDHAPASSSLEGDLSRAFDRGRGGPGGWWIVRGTEIHRGSDLTVPDVACRRKSRLPVLPREAFFTLPPDRVCEVLSPPTARLDRMRKRGVHAREGVSHAWRVDPTLETLEVFRLHEGRWLLVLTAEGNEAVRAEPVDAVELDRGGLWTPKG